MQIATAANNFHATCMHFQLNQSFIAIFKNHNPLSLSVLAKTATALARIAL
jgi:hypothetical protein